MRFALYHNDVMNVDGIWCFRVDNLNPNQTLKTDSSRRFVPIHSQLLALGLLDFIKERKGQLFPELTLHLGSYGHYFSRWFIVAFKEQGLILTEDGSLARQSVEGLRGRELIEALRKYADRARRGAEDAALLSGTSKDLLEPQQHTLTPKNLGLTRNNRMLGQAFVALGLATPEDKIEGLEASHRTMERGMFNTAIGINKLRNKQGTGHGRPWLPTIRESEAKAAIEMAGVISNYMIDKLES